MKMQGEQIWGIARTILSAVGGWAVGKGYVDNELMTAVLGGVGTIFIAGWSFWSKKQTPPAA
jgi:hypothetical protein